ncbi:efflux RND transporter periplasmic adaptor subunit [Paralimibaculum aggregatum]|uniref:Efflux RND transporter periplasmic adaptor subunit n=1 Tax=Paralimibaculum aggregatum TaxID=3036245 RepID=A0ABQ6LG59_9RHOB|nr:efflux RND transporter periplasmic adaptor subunit [Limibaculum sp. NKW23]GMG82309.1 efflux RND transporter periplasmic adaptor subunit [Limibaculum sp. NKW23]
MIWPNPANGRRATQVLTALALAFGLGLGPVAPLPAAAQAQGPAAVKAERVERRPVADTTPILAELVATTRSEVATRTAGIVSEVLFRVGDAVEAGALLVRLDRDLIDIRLRTSQAALEAAQAGVAVSEAQMRLAVQAFERQSQLRGSTAFSRGQFEDLEASVAQAQSELTRAAAQVARAEAELSRAEYDRRHAEIRAPFAGIVVAKAAQPGSYIALGAPVATLLDIGALEIEANIPVKLIGAVREGLAVEAVFQDGPTTEAVVRSLLPVETQTTRTRPVRFAVDLTAIDPARLASGRSVLLKVPVSVPREAVTVPKDALVQARGGWMVFVVEADKAVPRTITLGEPVGARMEVLSGLEPGEIVVVRGNERLRPGQPVTATLVPPVDRAPEAAATAPAPGRG